MSGPRMSLYLGAYEMIPDILLVLDGHFLNNKLINKITLCP